MASIQIYPQPRSMDLRGDSLVLGGEEIQALRSFRFGEELSLGRIQCTGEAEAMKEQGYRLGIEKEGVAITAADDAGVFYAVQTLLQLLEQGDGKTLPTGHIFDVPDYPVRGVLLDVSRNRIPSMDTLFYLIDLFASWKYNQLQLYFEHSFAYRQHKTVWEDADPFTADEVKKIKEYCRARGIELVPNQNSFGHMERWLKHDRYKELAESPDGFIDPWGEFREDSSTLAPVEPKVLPFLSELYDELLPCFDSEYLNIGGDEPWELGKGRSKELCEEQGVERVYLDFLLKLHSLAAEKGKKIQIYGDIIMKYPHLIKELPKDLILVDWGYEAKHPFREECSSMAEAGIPFYLCTGTSSWNSLAGRWMNTRDNILSGAENGLQYGASGFYVSEWGDNGHWQQQWAALPGFLFGACASWNLEAAREMDIEAALRWQLFQGEAALAEAAMLLQNVWECSGVPLHNISLPAVLLLDPTYPYYREEYARFRAYSFDKELALIHKALALLEQDIESEQASVFRRELLYTARLLKHGSKLGRLQFATDSLRIESIDREQRSFLARDLEGLRSEFESLWLRRSRKGGLAESLERFDALLKVYRT